VPQACWLTGDAPGGGNCPAGDTFAWRNTAAGIERQRGPKSTIFTTHFVQDMIRDYRALQHQANHSQASSLTSSGYFFLFVLSLFLVMKTHMFNKDNSLVFMKQATAMQGNLKKRDDSSIEATAAEAGW
jgi:hypothetical protein